MGIEQCVVLVLYFPRSRTLRWADTEAGFEEGCNEGCIADDSTVVQPRPVITCQSAGFQQQPDSLEPQSRAGPVWLGLTIKTKTGKKRERPSSSSCCTHCHPLNLGGFLINLPAPVACSSPGAILKLNKRTSRQ